MNPKELGAKLRKIRLPLCQASVAKAAGTTQGYVSEVERGRRNISLRALNKLVEALGYRLVLKLVRK